MSWLSTSPLLLVYRLCLLSSSVMSNSLWPHSLAAHQASLSMGILQARVLEWVAMPFARGSSQPRDWTQASCIAGGFFTNWATRKTKNTGVGILSLLQESSCMQTLTNHIGESLPGESMNQQSAPQNPILYCFYFPDCVAGNLLLLITFNNIFIFNIYNLLLEFDIHHSQVLPYPYRFGTTFSETPYNELLAPLFKSEIYLWPFSMR